MKMNRLIPMLPVKSMPASIVRSNGLDIPDLDVTFYGLTEFRLDDPDGNRLWIGQDRSTGA
jgi:hypothetical protein